MPPRLAGPGARTAPWKGDDMPEPTGGHYLDTGDGPTLLDPPAESALSTGDTAWRVYTAHRGACVQCRTHPIRCAEGDRLWNGYTAR